MQPRRRCSEHRAGWDGSRGLRDIRLCDGMRRIEGVREKASERAGARRDDRHTSKLIKIQRPRIFPSSSSAAPAGVPAATAHVPATAVAAASAAAATLPLLLPLLLLLQLLRVNETWTPTFEIKSTTRRWVISSALGVGRKFSNEISIVGNSPCILLPI